jgi:hypothetical protein
MSFKQQHLATGLVACINSVAEYAEYYTFAETNKVSETRFIWVNFEQPCPLEGVYVYIKPTLDNLVTSFVESISETMSTESIFFVLSENMFYVKKKSEILAAHSGTSSIFAKTFSYLKVSKKKSISTSTETLPRLSAMISLYNCDKYIDNLFQEIRKQTIKEDIEWLIGFYPTSFPVQCEQNVRNKLNNFLNEVPNIKIFEFVKLDMNLYALWNFLLLNASSPYLTSFHPDDIRTKTWGEICVSYLDTHQDVGLVTPVYYPCKENSFLLSTTHQKPWFLKRYEFHKNQESSQEEESTMITSSHFEECEDESEFAPKDLFAIDKDFQITPYDIPNACPVWRKLLHEKNLYFDETDNTPADLIMWLYIGSKMKMVQLLKCHVWFRISDQQLHRKHFFTKDVWESLLTKFASPDMIEFAKRRRKNKTGVKKENTTFTSDSLH